MDSVLPGLDAAPNIHPLLVHFPVVLWPAALVFMAIAYVKAKDDMFKYGTWLLYAGVISGIVAATTGWFAADGMGHDHPGHHLVHDHRNFMIAALALAAVAAGAAHWARTEKHRPKRWLPIGLLLIACLVTVLGADRGALLVYGHGMGVSKEPPAAAGSHGHGGHDHGSHDH